MDPDGTGSGREVLATHYEGKELNSPNDVVVAFDGAIYFTDPTVRAHARLRARARAGARLPGRLPDPARTAASRSCSSSDFEQPNGLCFSPDESLLYVNDTDRAHIRVFDVGADGTISNGRVFAEGIGDGDSRRASPSTA